MTSKELKIARNRIDKVDKALFKLIKKRTKIVKYMLSLKKQKSDIVDQKRIKEILKIIKKKSIQNNIDPIITKKIWSTMIWAYVDFQRRNFKKK